MRERAHHIMAQMMTMSGFPLAAGRALSTLPHSVQLTAAIQSFSEESRPIFEIRGFLREPRSAAGLAPPRKPPLGGDC
ncbi:MAG: hypothetical protein ACTFAK_04370 [Candidatus Electronema sp. VV]